MSTPDQQSSAQRAMKSNGKERSTDAPEFGAKTDPGFGEHHYPLDPWHVRETIFSPSMAARNESIFALGNGYLGLRGNFEEGFCNCVSGSYINGFFEEEPIVYGEIAHGYAKDRQFLVNVADAKGIRVFLDDEPFDMSAGTVLAYERSLDLKEGFLSRKITWRSPKGIEIELLFRRVVSQNRRHLAAIDLFANVISGNSYIRLESIIDINVNNLPSSSDPRIGGRGTNPPLQTVCVEAEGASGAVLQRTRNSKLAVACAIGHLTCEPKAVFERAATTSDGIAITFVASKSGAPIHLTKLIAYHTSLESEERSLIGRAKSTILEGTIGFDSLLAEQRSFWKEFWRKADIRIGGDQSAQQGLRFNLFHLFQSAGRNGRTSIAAKGLTSEGYDGHYFWDSEIYVAPFFNYTRPEVARSLLQFRCNTLDKAKERATDMSQHGALFPWRTIDGRESSAYFPAGTAQYHINADIVYGLRKYIDVTGDRKLLYERGAELVFETARLWADLGHYSPSKAGAFCIDEVTGPDEYTALVNNNLYTNLMARMNLLYAVEVAIDLKSNAPSQFENIAKSISLQDNEIEQWSRAAEKIYLPFDKERGIHLQDDQFLCRKVWDFANTPKEKYPLLLHYHPLVIYRHQVLKQPDVVLAQVLLAEQFNSAQKRRNFSFYDPLTTGDSSLAACIQSIAIAELGNSDIAYSYFTRTARMDLDDVNHNASSGLHMAAMGGTWMATVYGFAGMRDNGGQLSFSPSLPRNWSCLSFRLTYQQCLLEITLTHDCAQYELLEGESLKISHKARRLELNPNKKMTIDATPILECVIFDLDGVLTDTAEYHYQAWLRLSKERGYSFDRIVNERLKGISRMESLQIILDYNRVCLDQDEKQKIAALKNGYFKDLIESISPSDLLPGIHNFLIELRDAGVKIALASASHNAGSIISKLRIDGLFDAIVDPSKVLKGKPDPEIFLRAAEILSIPVENCVGVEDAVAGIAAIKAAGIFAVGVGNKLPEADWIISDTRELTYKNLLERYNAKNSRNSNDRAGPVSA